MQEKTPLWKGARGEWYVVIQFVIFAVIVFGPRSLAGWPEWGTSARVAGFVLGGLFGLVGGGMAITGLFFLGPNMSALPHPLDHAHLVLSGPYKFVRHPIYGGLVLLAFGWAGIVQGTLTLIYALVLLVFFDIKSRREEKWLLRKFPDYAVYQQETRKLLPFIY